MKNLMDATCARRISVVALAIAASASVYPAAAQSHAGYRMPDGTVQVVVPASLATFVSSLDELFTSTHNGMHFSVRVGDNYSAMAALSFDRTAFAALGCEFTRIGLGDNLKISAEPVGFRLAHASLRPGSGVPMLGVIVHPTNPLVSLSLTDLERIFAIGAPAGDIALWSQAGVTGPLGRRAVRPFGPPLSDYLDSDDPQAGEFLGNTLGGLNMNHSYQPLAHYEDVVARVREDPSAIGITALNLPLEDVKVIALKTTETSAARLPDAAQILRGGYPLDRFVYLYIRQAKGSPPDTFGLEYVRAALSDEGQRRIATDPSGYLPLSPAELAEERAKLDRASAADPSAKEAQ